MFVRRKQPLSLLTFHWTQASMSFSALLLLLTIARPCNNYSSSITLSTDFHFFSFFLSSKRFFLVLQILGFWGFFFNLFWICQLGLLNFCFLLLSYNNTVWRTSLQRHKKVKFTHVLEQFGVCVFPARKYIGIDSTSNNKLHSREHWLKPELWQIMWKNK